MSKKRIFDTSIDWKVFKTLVPPNQQHIFNAFRIKSSAYLARVMLYPPHPPEINWERYSQVIGKPGYVEALKKDYEAVKIPYPDTPQALTDEFARMEKALKEEIKVYNEKSDERIAKAREEIEYVENLLPYDQMTMDDYYDSFPEDAMDTVKRPTLWPHTPEEQVGFSKPKALPVVEEGGGEGDGGKKDEKKAAGKKDEKKAAGKKDEKKVVAEKKDDKKDDKKVAKKKDDKK